MHELIDLVQQFRHGEDPSGHLRLVDPAVGKGDRGHRRRRAGCSAGITARRIIGIPADRSGSVCHRNGIPLQELNEGLIDRAAGGFDRVGRLVREQDAGIVMGLYIVQDFRFAGPDTAGHAYDFHLCFLSRIDIPNIYCQDCMFLLCV